MLPYVCLLLIPYIVGGVIFHFVAGRNGSAYRVILEIANLFIVDVIIIFCAFGYWMGHKPEDISAKKLFLVVFLIGVVASLIIHNIAFKIINKYFKTKRDNYPLQKTLLGFVLFAVCFSTLATKTVDAEICLLNADNSDYAQLFFDYGSGYTEDLSSKEWYDDGKAKLTIPLWNFPLSSIRLDPVENVGEYKISELSIRLLGIPVKRYENDELLHIIGENTNFKILEKEDGLWISCDQSDSLCILSKDFTIALDKVLLLGGGLVSLILAFVVSLCCIKAISIKKWECYTEKIFLITNRIKKKPMIIAIVHYFICLWLQQLSFVFSRANLHRILLCQLLFFVFLQILWQLTWTVVKEYKRGNPKVKRVLLYAGIYFAMMFAMLILIWPGYFVADEWVMVNWCSNWIIHSTYGWLMHLQMILGMMLIPGVVGMEIFQIAIIALVIGYIFDKISLCLKHRKSIWFFYIPLCFPAVILNNFRLQRAVVGGYIELFLIVSILYSFLSKEKVTLKKCMSWALLIALTATMRTDGLYYVGLAPIVLYIVFKGIMSKRRIAITTLSIIVLSLGFNQIQNMQGVMALNHANIINFGRLIYAPLKENGYNTDSSEIEAIDQIIDVKQYMDADNVDDAMAWVREGASASDPETVRKFIAASIKLICQHPKAYLCQQWETYLMASGFSYFTDNAQLGEKASQGVQSSSNMFDPAYYDIYPYSWSEVLDPFYANEVNQPISQQLRKWVINFCQGRSPNDFQTIWPTSPIFLNVLIPTLGLFIAGVGLMLFKRWKIFSIWMLFSARIGILFLIEPYADFTYWTRVVVAGYLIIIYMLICLRDTIARRRGMKNVKNQCNHSLLVGRKKRSTDV